MLASIKLFWQKMGSKKISYLIAYLLSFAAISLAMANTVLLGKVVDVFLNEETMPLTGKMVGYFILALILLGLVTLTKTILNYIKVQLLERGSQEIVYNVRSELYDKLQNLDQSFYSRNSTGDLMATVTGDLDLIRHMFSWIFYQSFESILMFFGSFVVLLFINVKFTLLMLICAPVIVVLNFKMFRALKPYHAKNREQYATLNTLAKENITGNRVVRAFVREEYEKERMTKENKTLTERYMKTHVAWLKYNMPINFFSGFLNIIALFGGAFFVITDPTFTIGDLTIFTGMTWALNYPMLISGTIINDLQRYSASMEKIMNLLNAGTNIKNEPDAVSLDEEIEKIEFKDVTLTIDGTVILDRINLVINKGESVGIMGSTGSGKSMLVGMLARFFDPTDGAVLINGVDIRKYDLGSLRRKFGFSHQDVFLFSNTIEGNIAYAYPDMPSEEVYGYAKLAAADKFIRQTIDGYETIVGERGIGLSGGQKQRIALARALASKGEVVVLDDTTSAVDMETEKAIQESLDTLTDKTKIVIAQRISSVYKSDKIVIMEKGRITELGKHSELIKNGGYYSRVFMIQHGKDLELMKEVSADGQKHV